MKDSVKRIISVLLSLSLIFSISAVYANADTTSGTGDYYVKYGGTGDGRTVEDPAGSVHQAIQSINEDGLTTGDTANIYIIPNENGNNVTASSHTITPWFISGTDSAETVAHAANIIVQGYSGKPYLAYSSVMNMDVVLGGPTTFNNLNLFSGSSRQIYANGNSLTFGTNVSFFKLSGSSIANAYMPNVSLTKYVADTLVTKKQTVTYNCSGIAEGKLYIPSSNYDGQSHTQDFTLVLNNSQLGSHSAHCFNIQFGGGHVNAATHVFNKNLNIQIKNAAKVAFLNSTGAQSVSVLGGFQIMTNPTTTFAYPDGWGSLSNLTSLSADQGTWVLKVAQQNLISFSETAGTYNIDPEYIATATNIDNGLVVKSSNNQLTIPAGNWDITFGVKPTERNYYVISGGTGDGRTPETPAPSIRNVAATIAADALKAGDIANVFVMQRSDWNAAPASGTKRTNITPFRSTASNEVSSAPTLPCNMVIQSYGSSINYLAYHDVAGFNLDYSIVAHTEFKNINLLCQRWTYNNIVGNGFSVKFGDQVYFSKIDANWTGSTPENAYAPRIVMTKYIEGFQEVFSNKQTIEYATAGISDGYLYITNNNYTDWGWHTQDANIIFNHKDIGGVNPFIIQFGGSHTNATRHRFMKNLNINIKSAAKVRFTNGSQFIRAGETSGGLQVMGNSKTKYYNASGAETTLTDAVNSVTKIVDTNKWILTVVSSIDDILSYTPTAGRYRVNENYNAFAIDSNGVQYRSENGLLTLPAGSYTVSFSEKASEEYADYIFDRGSGLQNTYSKLTTGDKNLRVVYFGGSVTEGYGGPNFDGSKAWRNLIGEWLSGTFPEATVTNINKACGESGTFLGSYLVAKDVIAENPDLVFLEYSINDKYDNATYERASYQYETIVRQIKEELPYCDIITILVTDYSAANAARKVNGSKLHTQAQAHEDMAKYYNLPTLHVGRALADLLPDGFTYEQWRAICGAYDTVHLVEGGNKVYYDVIEEYLTNELVNGTYNGTLANYQLPELKSEYLLDGNITYIQPSEALLNRSVELGGSGVAYVHDTTFPLRGYDDIFNFYYTADNEHMLCVEFNGTELVGILHNYNDTRNGASNRTYQISIDGGEFTEHNFYHMNPTVFVTGLSRGNHVARIKVSVEDSSNWLWIGALFSRDETMRTSNAPDYSQEVVNENFQIEDPEIREGDSLGLRFIFNINKEFLGELPEIVEFGAITHSTDTTQGREIFLDTPIVTQWAWDSETKQKFTPQTTGATPKKVVASNILEEDENIIKYTLCLTDVNEAKYDNFYTVRGYIKYINHKGKTMVVYTENFQSSLYKIAAETPDSDKTPVEYGIIDYVENTRVQNYFAGTTVSAYFSGYPGNADTNPNHKIFGLSNGLIVRDVYVSGMANTEKTELCFITDPHFNYMNEKDILEKNQNVLSSYRGRDWLRGGSHLSTVINAVKFGSMFKKTIIGGDAVDYLSKGSLEMTQRLLTNKSVNGSIRMVMGNHEYMETCQPDMSGLTNKYSLEQRYAMVQNYWTNDVYFDYDIMKKNDGVTDNLMLIYMDNASNKYWASQIPKLENALSIARSKNIPVLIFQHIPMLTMNPGEKEYYIKEDWDGKTVFGSPSNYSKKIDMTSHSGYLGGANSDSSTLAVCEMIRKNYDIIKGVFTGHEHANMYTEIVGLNPDGSVATDSNGDICVIPQHTGYGVHYSGVMKITVE